MIYRLNRMSYEFAQKLIKNYLIVIDRDRDRIDHKPSRTRRKAFFDSDGPVEYGKWHLGEEQTSRNEVSSASPSCSATSSGYIAAR
jgi:hypothetical protein